jgi:hypothetical protein
MTAIIYKPVCVGEADDQWCIVTEYGKKDVVVLEGRAVHMRQPLVIRNNYVTHRRARGRIRDAAR